MSGTVDDVWQKPECTTATRFRDLKFSDDFVEQFLGPLFVGITLDPDLQITSRFTEFVFRMLSSGFGAVPLNGMGALGDQLVKRLPADGVRLNTPVEAVTATTVRTVGGESFESDAVIVAADMDASSGLVETPAFGWNSVRTYWFGSESAPYDEPLLFLNGTREGPVNNVAVMSNVSARYAPSGKHLTAASVPGQVNPDEADVRRQLRSWFGGAVDSWELLRVDQISKAQPRHLPGEDVPAVAELESGVFVAGDHRYNPSINGALQSGRSAARSALRSLRSR